MSRGAGTAMRLGGARESANRSQGQTNRGEIMNTMNRTPARGAGASPRVALATLAAAIATALHPLAARAQETPGSPNKADDESGLETIVVTGTASSSGVKKLEASYNIVTATEEEIRRANPRSTADLLKISPGMWPETSGGQTGANIEIAGFPGGGDAPYYTTQLMGSPLYGMPTLSFFETSSIFRLDDTVRSTEILQGGPSVVFAG